jgi:hypothetical protein
MLLNQRIDDGCFRVNTVEEVLLFRGYTVKKNVAEKKNAFIDVAIDSLA